MKVFACQACGQLLYFENVRCEHCGRSLGYLADKETISAIESPAESVGGGLWSALAANGEYYRFCKNQEYGVCNWLLPANSSETFCAACRYNHTVPNLAAPENRERWRKLEAAKHRLIYSLLKLRLPLANRVDRPDGGLEFNFLNEAPDVPGPVLTGHANGVITLAAKEADDPEREHVRTIMGEPYRTLLGHFRHESGHYFWDVLVRDPGLLDSFRAVFGQEHEDYAAALQAYYKNGPPGDWQQRFVTPYASAHPWEDFAETWAHYLHIVDTLETAQSFSVKVQARANAADIKAAITFEPHQAATIEQLIDAWLPLSFAVNSLNRSMGQADLYPFILAPAAIGKLGYVHALVHGGLATPADSQPRSRKRAVSNV